MGMATMRRVQIVAQDPSVRRNGEIVTAWITIPYEEVELGPLGYAVHVVDYDASSQTLYRPAELGTSAQIAAPPSDEILADPDIHARTAYALVMQTLHRFEVALGRRVAWGTGGPQLYVVPHAFEQANAYYSEDSEALVFGYVRSPHAPTFFGLSHDIVVHETTHALLDGLRDGFTNPSSPDQAALHEGLADIVALLSVFSLPEILIPFVDEIPGRPDGSRRNKPPAGMLERDAVSRERLTQTVLFGLADELRGDAPEARVNALRRSVLIKPARDLLDQFEFEEPHRRGEVLVAAVLDAFVDAWVERVVAGLSPETLYVSRDRVAEEGATIAEILLTMAIRAIDYTPPEHIEFGDYLSAMLTADREVRADDSRYRLRARLLGSFAAFGIKPASGTADGTWSPPKAKLGRFGTHLTSLQDDATEAFRLVWANRGPLELDPEAFTRVTSVRPAFRISPEDGFNIRETVVEVTQYLKIPASALAQYHLRKPEGMADDQDVVLRGGSTLILDEYGDLKYVVTNPVPNRAPRQSVERRERAQRRLDYLWENGFLDVGASLAKSLPAFHRARLLDDTLAKGRRHRSIPTTREEAWT
jgi:hypothetical protein